MAVRRSVSSTLCERLIDANPQDWRARLALSRHYAAQAGIATRSICCSRRSPQSAWPRRSPGDLAGATALELDPALVRRYVALTRDAVFYLDPHVCTRCRYRSTELLWQCPQCHEWNTFVEERIAPAKESRWRKRFRCEAESVTTRCAHGRYRDRQEPRARGVRAPAFRPSMPTCLLVRRWRRARRGSRAVVVASARASWTPRRSQPA